jgi:hypothetical protein
MWIAPRVKNTRTEKRPGLNKDENGCVERELPIWDSARPRY